MPSKAFCLLFTLISFLSLSQMVRADLPKNFEAVYTLHYDDLRIGLMNRKFVRNGNSGYFESNSHLTGLAAMFRKDKVEEISHWTIKNDQFQPTKYQYSRTGSDRVKTVEHIFDWDNKQVHMTYNDGKETLPISDHTVDKLLYQLNLMTLPTDSDELKFHISDGLQLKDYTFEFQESEELTTPMGKIETRKYIRKRKNDEKSKRSTVVWCAPSLHNLPVRVDIVDRKGHFTSIILKELSGLN